MTAVSDYTSLITSEHADKPLFIAVVSLLVQQAVDNQAVLQQMQTLFDLDTAVGTQLDAIGIWVGFSRYVFVNPTLGTITLDDSDYRTLLRARILRNHWDGTNSQLQVILANIFPGTGITMFAIDNQDMSMDIFITAGTLTPTQIALIESGLLIPRPEGVLIAGYAYLTGPLFGLDFENAAIAGLDVGEFINFI